MLGSQGAACHELCLPKSAQPGTTKAVRWIYNAEDRAHAEKAIESCARTSDTKWPKAVSKTTDDQGELLAFYDFPTEHWVHLRTTNPIESTFSTVKLRTGGRQPGRGPSDGLQGRRVRSDTLARDHRRPPGPARPCRRPVRERRPGRAGGDRSGMNSGGAPATAFEVIRPCRMTIQNGTKRSRPTPPPAIPAVLKCLTSGRAG
ncbi:transposase [Streptomyces aureus]|uniref:transposase n=1 Tax=Streptomyces aureus TaxID=193461 RepID=UPI0033FFF22F